MKTDLLYRFRTVISIVTLLATTLGLTGCGVSLGGLLGQDDSLYVPLLLEKAQAYNGQNIVVNGTYVGRDGKTVLALGVSTLDNGLGAEPVGEQIWLEGFPEPTIKDTMHQPGDAIYGFVRVAGRFETGAAYGPENAFKHRIQVASAEAIQRVQRAEVRIPNEAPGEGKIALGDLLADPAKYDGQTITTRGYYFWNGQINVLAEGVSFEKDGRNSKSGSNPQPAGQSIWMEGFPPEESGKLNLSPNKPPSFVWGYVEVTGIFKNGSGAGRDGLFLQATGAQALER